MRNLLSFKVSEKVLSGFTWGIIACIALIALKRFPLHTVAVGDENYYVTEVAYFAQYGIYHSLAQGTSFIYTFLIFLFSKVFFTSFLIGAKILSAISFFICCKLLSKCFGLCTEVRYKEKCIGLTFFAVIVYGGIWKALPDLLSVSFLLAAFPLIVKNKGYKYIVLAGVLIFLGFASKPVTLFAIPGLSLFLFFKNLRNQTVKDNFINTLLFICVFILCFVLYHLPGYNSYHKLMLEDKNHYYNGVERVENKVSWGELNVYFEGYNVHHKVNKWAVTFAEVDSFEKQYPEINLKPGFTGYIKQHPSSFTKNIIERVFFELPYYVQRGFFFAKWTSINRLVKNIIVIKVITLLVFLSLLYFERKFIRQNLLLILVPFLFYLELSVYLIPGLEDNWLYFCLPFFALPVIKFLLQYFNAFFLLALQFIFFLV